jgi:hypothetical protein
VNNWILNRAGRGQLTLILIGDRNLRDAGDMVAFATMHKPGSTVGAVIWNDT